MLRSVESEFRYLLQLVCEIQAAIDAQNRIIPEYAIKHISHDDGRQHAEVLAPTAASIPASNRAKNGIGGSAARVLISSPLKTPPGWVRRCFSQALTSPNQADFPDRSDPP